MFTEDSKINFNCNICGKCCKEQPRLNFYEMLELSDEFIIQMAHRTFYSHLSNPIDKVSARHLENIANIIVIPEFDCSIFYYIDFTPIVFERDINCSKLFENKCSIYGKRPVSCRLAPLDLFYPEQEQWKPINLFIKNKLNEKWDCSFLENEPIIYDNKKPNSQLGLYNQSLYTIREITDKYFEYLNNLGEDKKNEHLKNIFEATQKKKTIYHDIVQALQMGIYHNIIIPEYAKKIISNQIILLEKKIIELKSIKNISKLQYEQITILLDFYKKVLSNNILDSENNNFGVI